MLNSEVEFQSESKRSGDEFEERVRQDLIVRGFDDFDRNVYIKNSGCEVDFLVKFNRFPLFLVEAKGGKDGENKRPGAQRTDNVKKAIANGALIKAEYESAYYIVYFSAYPDEGGYSDIMIKSALRNGLVDEVRYLLEE